MPAAYGDTTFFPLATHARSKRSYQLEVATATSRLVHSAHVVANWISYRLKTQQEVLLEKLYHHLLWHMLRQKKAEDLSKGTSVLERHQGKSGTLSWQQIALLYPLAMLSRLALHARWSVCPTTS